MQLISQSLLLSTNEYEVKQVAVIENLLVRNTQFSLLFNPLHILGSSWIIL